MRLFARVILALLGGGLIASGAPPGKDKFDEYRSYLLRRIRNSNVRVHLESSLDAVWLVRAAPQCFRTKTNLVQHRCGKLGVNRFAIV